MSENTLLFSAQDLKKFSEDVLMTVGVPAPKAELVASSLVAANLRAVDSHGVQLLAFYLERLERLEVDPRAEGHVVSETGACLLYDGGNGLGQVVADICCGHAVRLARQHGIAIVVARESNHFGTCAYWAQKISAAGCLGIVMCNSSAIVPPWQGKEGRIGTNPLCMSVPGGDGKPWLLDMATTTVAAGKIFKAFMSGQPNIPAGWAFDSAGVPTTDTREAYAGTLMPLGGYKGSGLGVMVEILCAVLSGGAMSTEVGGIRSRGAKAHTSQMFMAIDVSRLLPLDQFQERMRWLVGSVKSAQPAAGYDEVLVAGDPEWRAEELRLREGIPVPEGVWEKLAAEAARLNAPVPQGTPASGSY